MTKSWHKRQLVIRLHGQHMLRSEETAERLVKSAKITEEDAVLEIGTGLGIITKLLAQSAKRVVSYEIDPFLFNSAVKSLSQLKNLEIRLGDAFNPKNKMKFDICVTSLPYSESLRFIKWLSLRSGCFKRCVAIVQSEFAEKICSKTGSRSYRAVSVIAQNSYKIERLFLIPKGEFEPAPKILSEALELSPNNDLTQPFFSVKRFVLVNQLFSFRGRLLSVAIKKITREYPKTNLPDQLLNTRIENLTPTQIAGLIPTIEMG